MILQKQTKRRKKAAADYFIRDFFDVLKTLTKGAELKNMNHDFYLYAGKIWKNAGGRALILPLLSETDMWIIRDHGLCDRKPSFRIKRISCRNYFSTGWKDPESICICRRTATGISAGNMDSMVNHYSVSKNEEEQMLIPQAERWETPGPCLCCVWKSDTTEI